MGTSFFHTHFTSFDTHASLLTVLVGFLKFYFILAVHGGEWMICHFSIVQLHFVFLLIEFQYTLSVSYKILPILLTFIVFWLRCDRPSRLLLFVPALLLSILTPLFLPSSSVSLCFLFWLFPCASDWESTNEWYLPFFARRNYLFGPKLRLSKSNQIKLNSFLLFPCMSFWGDIRA